MKYTIVGLGNPGEEYENTRHNVGRMMLENVLRKNGMPELSKSGKYNALASQGEIKGEKVLALAPETYMNKSGSSVSLAVSAKSKKDIERMIVIYDDIDLPIGTLRISFNRSSGGHKGVESIIKALKSESFVRIRIGICPVAPSGKLKKPQGEEKILDFLMGEFKEKELEILQKVMKRTNEAVVMIIAEGREKAMGEFNRN